MTDWHPLDDNLLAASMGKITLITSVDYILTVGDTIPQTGWRMERVN